MNFSKTCFLCFAVFVAWQVKGSILRAKSNERASLATIAEHGLKGDYIMQEDTGNARLALLFLDKSRVQILGDGKPWGKNNGMCSYTVNGANLDLTHACGVFHLAIKGAVLEDVQHNWHYKLSP